MMLISGSWSTQTGRLDQWSAYVDLSMLLVLTCFNPRETQVGTSVGPYVGYVGGGHGPQMMAGGHQKIHRQICTEACQLASLWRHRTFATGHGHLPLTTWLSTIFHRNTWIHSFAFTTKFGRQRTSTLGLLEQREKSGLLDLVQLGHDISIHKSFSRPRAAVAFPDT